MCVVTEWISMKSQTQNAQLSFKPITRSMHNNNNGDDNDGVKKIVCDIRLVLYFSVHYRNCSAGLGVLVHIEWAR